ncbi:MAG: transcription elongation factor GreA [Candidatus Woykebacteria bacterium RIFCSPLOWO2_01_FULL_43_14]|uniref:Transcription elongation factor GreA n=2 Tax=Candidatus Woykeibacteriota TaxID=1817899 RepID=A0A1G1WWW5_9BACT|nr:MAG: transcription elongation factor GreA [Candidatus Woykebacteria bacterium RIFCSPHIGHO2_02_FULL_43_16b]OGY31840.1 MAG: transcription elongation factor GreA [Candidatus Woykebacteria bacterium RIFCSPLOWO2_01_FULL_43_14]
MKKMYLTKETLDKLKQELEHLTNVKRKEVTARIAKAREYGDISENSEYDAARDDQSFIEGRIAELQEILKDSKVLEKPSSTDFVSIGSCVVVEVDGQNDEFEIVSSIEANPIQGRISNESLVGKALLGSKVGDTITVSSTIKATYKILEIK